jgi:hypothetical protein
MFPSRRGLGCEFRVGAERPTEVRFEPGDLAPFRNHAIGLEAPCQKPYVRHIVRRRFDGIVARAAGAA